MDIPFLLAREESGSCTGFGFQEIPKSQNHLGPQVLGGLGVEL